MGKISVIYVKFFLDILHDKNYQHWLIFTELFKKLSGSFFKTQCMHECIKF